MRPSGATCLPTDCCFSELPAENVSPHVKIMPFILIKLKSKTKIHLNLAIGRTQVVSYIVRM
jgi:hypothetical protein